MVPLGVDAQVEAHFGPFGESVNLDQDGCTVCVEQIIGSEIIFRYLMELLGDVGHVEPHLFP